MSTGNLKQFMDVAYGREAEPEGEATPASGARSRWAFNRYSDAEKSDMRQREHPRNFVPPTKRNRCGAGRI